MATKKGGGSSNNGRTANPKYLGLKAAHGEKIPAGSIIVRQRGTKICAGENVGMGKDHTLFATQDGYVFFADGYKKRKFVHIKIQHLNNAHID